ncbi:MAG: hypothetical protein AAGK30_12070 [Pseudomonadota bacterium]
MGKAVSARVHVAGMSAAPNAFDDDKLCGFDEDLSITVVEPIRVLTERSHGAF